MAGRVGRGGKLRITIEITRSGAGMFYARSKQAPTFFAAHNDEQVLRQNLARAVDLWGESQGCRVHFTLASRQAKKAARATPQAIPA